MKFEVTPQVAQIRDVASAYDENPLFALLRQDDHDPDDNYEQFARQRTMELVREAAKGIEWNGNPSEQDVEQAIEQFGVKAVIAMLKYTAKHVDNPVHWNYITMSLANNRREAG